MTNKFRYVYEYFNLQLEFLGTTMDVRKFSRYIKEKIDESQKIYNSINNILSDNPNKNDLEFLIHVIIIGLDKQEKFIKQLNKSDEKQRLQMIQNLSPKLNILGPVDLLEYMINIYIKPMILNYTPNFYLELITPIRNVSKLSRELEMPRYCIINYNMMLAEINYVFFIELLYKYGRIERDEILNYL